MSGHSKWATIHRQKEAADQKKGMMFTKVANAIIVAIKQGGGVTDPELNFKLRLAMEKAKEINMPKENIQRAIERAIGKGEGSTFEEIIYEAYGPGGVGYLIEAATDNRQRTVQLVKNVLDRGGGNIASPGSVSFNFRKTGLITLEIKENKEDLILKLIDLGAEDVEETQDVLEVYVSPDRLMEFKEKLVAEGIQPKSVEIIQRPLNYVYISDPKIAQQNLNLVEKLEEIDDVQRVYSNFDIPEEIIDFSPNN